VKSLKVVSFNLQNGQPWSEESPDSTEVRLEDSIDFLRSLEADILFLQEVERGHDGGHQVEPPPNFTALRIALAPYHSCFSYPPVNPDELPFGLGLAIFSKTPLIETRKEILPAAGVSFAFDGRKRQPSERLLVKANTTVAGRTIRLLNAHLQAFFMIDASSDDHRMQRNAVEKELRSSNLPTLMGGDFNTAPNESLLAQFEAVGYRTAQNTVPTWKRRAYVTDHLFFNSSWHLERVEVIRTNTSDHDAVVASLTLQ